ncbi:MAG: restriction endonuclease subunit S [Planktothrix agardhii KL2]|jgi:type I restriction enzyme S subunit|uniref:restriction endonuclease subunit S n=1 Tax=Planktothrix agardhii TaxID=1160 RepID=UPI001A30FC5B|nr:restriction endonuclease subunit S [Planktothrix agardhii]MBG0746314.1 restriction endonuclease subunit S [Planktothrix agardhii KL2]
MELVRLENICDIKSGGTPSRNEKDNYGGLIPWAKISDIEASNGNLFTTEETITEKGLKAIHNRIFDKGTLLFAMYGSVGKIAFTQVKVSTNQAILGINIKDESKLYDRYLYYWLLRKKHEFLHLANGVTQKNLSTTFVRNLEIPLPPIASQRRIADILDKADEIIRKRKEAIALTEQLLKSTFLDMFGDPVINPKGWEVKKLEEVCYKVTDGTHQSPEWSISGIPFLFVSNIVNGEIDFNVSKYISEDFWQKLTLRCPIEINDILYTTVGSYGNVALVRTDKKFCFQRHIAHIKPDNSKINPEFLLGLMQSDGIKRQADQQVRGIAQKTLNLKELKSFQVFNPPINLQKKYAAIRRKIESKLQKQQKMLQESENLFNSLLQKAFKGEL